MDGLHLEHLLAASVFIGARISGLMVFCPFLGSNVIPAPLKAALAILMTGLLYPLQGPLPLNFGPWQLVGIALSEFIIGLVLGLAASFMIEAPLLAGQVLGVQMGYSLTALFDPQTQADTPVLAQFQQLASVLIFLQLNVHHWLLRGIVSSFTYLPPGPAPATFAAAGELLHGAGGIFLAGVQIAAPALVATMIADVALGFLGKASSQMPVLFIGIAIKNLLGLAVLIAAVAYWPYAFSQRFAECVATGERALHLAH